MLLAIATAIALATAWWHTGDFVALWLTPDQLGRLRYESGDHATAATTFTEPMWKGVAHYRAGDYAAAVDWFSRLESAESYYNLGNAYAQLNDLEMAVASYDRALERRPGWGDATANRQLVSSLIAPEEALPQEIPTGPPNLEADAIEVDLEEDQGDPGEVEMSAFTDEQVAQMWLSQLDVSPAGFLRTKFALQVARDAAADGSEARR